MHDEDGFLAAIRQTPADDVARLVFADWLDEQDDPTCKLKADFIRLELRMAETPEKSLNRVRWLHRLQKLAAKLPPAWLAVVSHPKLEACRLSFRFECPKQWEKLEPTTAPKIRFCESCQQPVHYCNSLQEARYHANRGNCVALSLALIRKPDDLIPTRLGAAGLPDQLTPEQIEQLRTSMARAGSIRLDEPEPPPTPPLVPRWDPVPEPEDRSRDRRARKKRQRRQRNIQRENWEEME